ncbi:MAG TPA: histidine phosphatase family protein [Azospirillaceae bacterium]|nr:histidine phosphatase family protein [Azospirillaceae bacterium]
MAAGRLSGIAVALVAALLALARPASADEALWDRLREGGRIVLLRHMATTSGVGDPPGFRLEDCATQRNLSPAGRLQAEALGRAFRERGVAVTRVLSSEWCRCLDTANLLGLGTVERFEPLNSIFQASPEGPRRTAALRAFIRDWRGPGNALLVTHQVNITALTGEVPAMGAALVLSPVPAPGPEGFTLLGRLPPPPIPDSKETTP